VAQTVDFKELVLHQVVSFSTRFVQYVVAIYASQHKITLPELRTLFLLGRFGNLAPIRLAELATTDRATATRAVNALRRRTLVRVRSDATHHKRTLASLTPAGVDLHDRLATLAKYRNEWLKDRFTDAELSTLLALLQRLEDLAKALPTRLPADTGND
jgi:DNA-binding MarR family transcriptional regulator